MYPAIGSLVFVSGALALNTRFSNQMQLLAIGSKKKFAKRFITSEATALQPFAEANITQLLNFWVAQGFGISKRPTIDVVFIFFSLIFFKKRFSFCKYYSRT